VGRDLRLVFLYINAAAGADQTGDLTNMWRNPSFVAEPIDRRPAYDRAGLLATLSAMTSAFAVDYIRTLDVDGRDRPSEPDHIDHIAAAHFATQANVDGNGLARLSLYSYTAYPAPAAGQLRLAVG
jgi:hypothetical protein